MEVWFSKSIMAAFCIVPSFIAIPFFKFRYGIDPLVFLAWYFGATAISILVYYHYVDEVERSYRRRLYWQLSS
tara:strand:+ start:182 stop:400 length:219 start_codon:yes stop_codon:yes gene_type:complete